MIQLHCGDCLEVMRTLPDGCVDAVVLDPPSGIGFMQKKWDSFRSRDFFIAFLRDRLAEMLRLAKPGAHLLCWAIPRTSHWTGTAIEDAGWVIEDRISHLFGTGFPKHKSKLKPACEDWWLATKPGGKKWLNVDSCRIPAPGGLTNGGTQKGKNGPTYAQDKWTQNWHRERSPEHPAGRWPANVTLEHHPECNGACHPECPVRLLDEMSGVSKSNVRPPCPDKPKAGLGTWEMHPRKLHLPRGHSDSGGASRFFYCAKASRRDRGEGNTHPTVKSTDLMRWLIRLVTPPGGTVLDGFAGSGSTGKAAVLEGFDFIGIEQDPESHAIAERRIAEAQAETALFTNA